MSELALENNFKVVLVGESGVGKSCMIIRYFTNLYNDTLKPTIGCDYYEKDFTIAGKAMKLNIWDTAGQERFRGLSSCYYKKAKAIILVFDLSKKASFDNLPEWIDQLDNLGDKTSLLILVGNKKDLIEKKAINSEDIDIFCKNKGISKYFQCSALDNNDKNLDNLFSYIAETLMSKDPREFERKEEGLQIEKKDLLSLNSKKEDDCKC